MARPAPTVPDEPEPPTHRIFKQEPLASYNEGFLVHVKECGRPETYPGLFHGKIPRDEEFKRLKSFTIDRFKRPDMDMAPCPRCGQDDKYLSGDLAWFPRLQIVAAIGHCCASHEAAAAADADFKRRSDQEFRDKFLEANLPLQGARLDMLDELGLACAAAQKLYRAFRLNGNELHTFLRGFKKSQGGQLIVQKLLRDENDAELESDYVGPAGFGGRGERGVITRDTVLGRMTGLVALSSDFHPVKDLELMEQQLRSLGDAFYEEATYEFIFKYSPKQQDIAIGIIQGVGNRASKLMDRLDEFWQFFTRPNIELIHAYGDHADSPHGFKATYSVTDGRPSVKFWSRDYSCRLSVPAEATEPLPAWPTTKVSDENV